MEDGKEFFVPDNIMIEYYDIPNWHAVKIKNRRPDQLTGNTVNIIDIDKINARALSITFRHRGKKQVAITELECY